MLTTSLLIPEMVFSSGNMYELIILEQEYICPEIFRSYAVGIGDLSKVLKAMARAAQINASEIIVEPQSMHLVENKVAPYLVA